MSQIVEFMAPKYGVRLNKIGTTEISDELLAMIESGKYTIEPKLDGTRVMIVKRDGHVDLWGRGMVKTGHEDERVQRNYREQFPELVEDLDWLPDGTMIDGEIVIRNDKGEIDFNLLQRRVTRKHGVEQMAAQHPAKIIAFDLPMGWNTHSEPAGLKARREALVRMIGPMGRGLLELVSMLEDPSEMILEVVDVIRFDREGVMVKDLEAPYVYGKGAWWKSKRTWTEDFFVMGKTEGTGKRQPTFGGLQCYRIESGMPIWQVLVGGGFTDDDLEGLNEVIPDVLDRLGRDEAKKMYRELEAQGGPVVIEVEHFGKMRHGFRHPNFLRVRMDKSPEDCTEEVPLGTRPGTLDDFF